MQWSDSFANPGTSGNSYPASPLLNVQAVAGQRRRRAAPQPGRLDLPGLSNNGPFGKMRSDHGGYIRAGVPPVQRSGSDSIP